MADRKALVVVSGGVREIAAGDVLSTGYTTHPEGLVSTVADVDLKPFGGGTSNLLTVPSGFRLVVTRITFRATAVIAVTTPPTVSAGDVLGSTTLTNLTTRRALHDVRTNPRMLEPGEVVTLTINSGTAADAIYADVEVWGYYIPVFLPTSVSGLAVWLDPSYGAYQERTSPTTPSAAGDPVGTWIARTGHVFTAASDSGRPTMRAGANGRPYLEFDGTNDSLTGDTSTRSVSASAGALSVVIASKVTSLRSGSSQRNDFVWIATGTAATNRFSLHTFGNGTNAQFRFLGRRLDSDSLQTLVDGANDTNWKVVSAVANYSSATAAVYNGIPTAVSTFSFQTSGQSSSNNSASGIEIGWSSAASSYCAGHFGDVVITRSALTLLERAKLIDWMASRYPT